VTEREIGARRKRGRDLVKGEWWKEWKGAGGGDPTCLGNGKGGGGLGWGDTVYEEEAHGRTRNTEKAATGKGGH